MSKLGFFKGDSMKKRHGLSKSRSQKVFRKTARGSHPRNRVGRPMRGGIRM